MTRLLRRKPKTPANADVAAQQDAFVKKHAPERTAAEQRQTRHILTLIDQEIKRLETRHRIVTAKALRCPVHSNGRELAAAELHLIITQRQYLQALRHVTERRLRLSITIDDPAGEPSNGDGRAR